MEQPPQQLLPNVQVEIWKKIVDVQQHFNDLELRIRNYALVTTGAFLGLGGYAIKDGGIIIFGGYSISVAGLVVMPAIFPLIAFYFMDRFWYHRLLDGAVQAGIEAESALKANGYSVNLGTEISKASPFKLPLIKSPIRSKRKMDFFYGLLILGLIMISSLLAFFMQPQALKSGSGNPTQVTAPGADQTSVKP